MVGTILKLLIKFIELKFKGTRSAKCLHNCTHPNPCVTVGPEAFAGAAESS